MILHSIPQKKKRERKKKRWRGSQINWNPQREQFLFRPITKRNAVHKSDCLLTAIAIEEKNLYKGKRGNFRAYMIPLSIFQPIPSPYLHTEITIPSSPPPFEIGGFVSFHTFPFTLFIDDSYGFRGQILDRERGGGSAAFSRYLEQKLLVNGYKTNKGNSPLRSNLGGKFRIYSDAWRLAIRGQSVLRLIRKRRDNVCTRLLIKLRDRDKLQLRLRWTVGGRIC